MDSERMVKELQERDGRLSLVTKIAKQVRRGDTVESIVQTTVEGVAAYFPDFDTSYATADPQGFLAFCTARPGGSIDTTQRRFRVTLPDGYLDAIRARDLIAATDAADRHEVGALADALNSSRIRGYLSAPIEHEGGRLGLLAIHSKHPHSWTEHEKATVRAAADILAVAIDDAARRQQLRENESRLRDVLDQLGDGVSVVADGKLVYVNPTLCRMFGYDADELLGTDPISFLADSTQRDARTLMDRHANRLASVGPPNELDAVRKDGTTIVVEAITRQIEYSGVPALVTTVRDLTQRKRNEQKIREHEARMQTVLENHPDGGLLIVDDKIAYANPAICEMSGFEADDLIGKEPVATLAPQEYERALEQKQLATTTQRANLVPSEYEGIRRDGTTMPVEVVASPPTRYGDSQAVFVTIKDLTERRSAERAVRETEAKYRTLVEHSLAGVYIIQNHRFVYCNPQMSEIFGYTQDELLTLPNMLGLAIEDRPAIEARLHDRLEGSVPSSHYSFPGRRKDGRTVHVEVYGAGTELEGQPAIIGTCLDISKRVEHDEAVQASERRFRTLFEQAPIGIVVAKPDTTFLRVNTTFCEMLGYSEAELVGRSFIDITHDDDMGGTAESAARVLEDARSGIRFTKRYVRKDATLVQAETTVSLVRDDSGNPEYALAMIVDVTERHELEAQFQQAQRLESVEQLAGGVAHNFNNALTAIYGYSELLANRFSPDDPAVQDLERIKRVTEQSANLTRQLLAFSRTERLRLSVFSLNEVVDGARDMLGPILGEHVGLVLHLDDALPHARSDRGQMEQVLTNLILNARDAMPRGGTLTVETKRMTVDHVFARTNPDARPGRYVALIVTDTGLGMDEDTTDRVFEPFFTTKDQGVGLGLAMVHGAVKHSGGFVSVTSTVGVGSSFAVCLPEHDDLEAQPRASAINAPATS